MYSLIWHGILLYNFHKYCMIYRLSMFEKLKNIMRDTVCRRFLHHIVLSYYIWDNVCRTFMCHIVVNYYIKATDVKKNRNPFCSKLLHFAYRCQCSCKAKCSNYYILQRYYILGCDKPFVNNAVGITEETSRSPHIRLFLSQTWRKQTQQFMASIFSVMIIQRKS